MDPLSLAYNTTHSYCRRWVRLFNYDTGEELDCNKGHHGPVHAVRFAPTYEMYASGSEDGTIRMWPMTPAGENGTAK